MDYDGQLSEVCARKHMWGRNDVRPGLLKVKNEPLSLGPS